MKMMMMKPTLLLRTIHLYSVIEKQDNQWLYCPAANKHKNNLLEEPVQEFTSVNY